jgi:uncharacterized membrane-anchored protein
MGGSGRIVHFGAVVGIALMAILATPSLARAQSTPAAQSEEAQSEEAQSEEAQSEEAQADELKAAWMAGARAATEGPGDITLIDQATLRLPAGYGFIPKAEGTRILRALGNTVGESTFVGLIVGTKPGDEWIVSTRFIKEGYIKDDDAKNWDADELLTNIKEGTAQANKDRAARGFPELEVLGWVEKPAYDSATHRLVWSLLAKQKDDADTADNNVNYNTYALGREGYFSLNLLTSSNRVDADKDAAHELLAALSYAPGKGYEDFNASTDHIAEYGIAALVGGVVAKKLGLFALVGVFVAKFAKVIGLAALAFGSAVWNFFRRKPKSASTNA